MKDVCQTQLSRRLFVRSAALTGMALATAPISRQRGHEPLPALKRPDGPSESVASDEAFWRRVAAHYRVSNRITNLEGGYWGIMAVPVLAEYVRHMERVNVEPDDPEMVGAITSFRLHGRTSSEDNQRVVDDLRVRYGLFTVVRTGLERGACVRVTPALYNGPADVDRLVAALKQVASIT